VRKALRVYARARDIQEQRGPQRQAALINLEMARLALGLGASDLALAFECATAALEAFVQSGGDGERARTLCLLAEIYLHAGFESQREDVEQAVRCLTEAQGLFLRLEIADEYHAARDLLTRARGYTCETL
jgi:tetratricopeptide (TPR) repeat protein